MLGLLASSVASAARPDPLTWATDADAGDSAVRLAFVGDLPAAETLRAEIVREVMGTRPDIVVLTGMSAREDPVSWGLPEGQAVMATSDAAPSRRWLKRFDGIGVDALPRAVPWGTVDRTTKGTRWRILYATTWPQPDKQWQEQGYWLPKALDREGYDRLIVLADRPVHTLSTEHGTAGGAARLLDAVQDGADPLSFALIVSGGTGTNEVLAPGGRFGELHLVAGSSGGPTTPFRRAGGGGLTPRKTLEPAYVGALQELGAFPTPEADTFEDPAAAAPAEVSGFWTLELDGRDATLDFHVLTSKSTSTDAEVSYRLVRGKTGWEAP